MNARPPRSKAKKAKKMKASKSAKPAKPAPAKAPGPDSKSVFALLRMMRKDPIGALMDGHSKFGDVIRFRVGPRQAILIADPEHIKYVLTENHRNFNKQTPGFDALREVIGKGLLTSEGDFWLRQRRIASPAFHRKRIAGLGEAMTRLTVEMLDEWETRDPAAPLEVSDEMMRLTLRIVSQTLLSTDVTTEAHEVGEALTVAMEHANEALTKIVELPHWVPTPRNLKMKWAVKVLTEIVDRVIAERRDVSPEDAPNDLLTMLMEARDEESGEGMSNRQLRDEVLTIFLAGHETTANALTWTWYLLSKYPAAARTLDEELQQVLDGRVPTIMDIPQLEYTTRVVQEAMRLYPPAWVIARSAVEADEIGGFEIPKAAFVFFSPYLTHRHPRYWDNPEGFDPDRFAPEKVESRPRYAYFPFGGGPRQCIGNRFAMMELQLIVATMAQRARLELLPGHPVATDPIITLRPKHGMKMTRHRPAPGTDPGRRSRG